MHQFIYRQSNMELFRIVSMLLVLVVHATFYANGFTYYESIHQHPFEAFVFSEMEALSLVCVNCFVIISGYFGIRQSWRGMCKLLFIVYFWRYAIYVGHVVLGNGLFSVSEVLFLLNPFSCNWFVGAYIGLYVFAFFINSFIARSDKKNFKNVLIIYWSLQLTIGWLLGIGTNASMDFGNGYTVLSLVGVYMLGRYIRLYIEPECQNGKWTVLFGYFAFCSINTILFLWLKGMSGDIISDLVIDNWFVSYNSIFTVCATVCLLLFFSKIHIQSRIINTLSVSAFPVYIIHMNDNVINYYLYCARWLKTNLNIFEWVPAVLVFVILVYILCFVIDRPRVWLWDCLERRSVHK